jgi:hypothetical protein
MQLLAKLRKTGTAQKLESPIQKLTKFEDLSLKNQELLRGELQLPLHYKYLLG